MVSAIPYIRNILIDTISHLVFIAPAPSSTKDFMVPIYQSETLQRSYLCLINQMYGIRIARRKLKIKEQNCKKN